MADIAEQIRFGFLFERLEITFSHGSIVPVSNFEQIAKAVSKLLHKDGYYYPPIEKDRVIKPGSKIARTVPKTKRPAHLFSIPASHVLYIVPAKPEKDVREASAGFILHLLSLLFQTRLQFADWSIDGRIPIGSDRGISPIIYDPGIIGDRLSLGYEVWSGWPEPEQKRFVNILYMFSRSCIYEWDWEEFFIQYMVFDACWKMGEALFIDLKPKGRNRVPHGERPAKLFGRFGINHPLLSDVGELARLRNELFHEATWNKGRPGHSSPTRRLKFAPGMTLRWLNDRLIRHFLGLQ